MTAVKGIITEIQRFSLNDGPGIRTTVFLKGCNMKCAWCHNPETISGEREIHYYEQSCIGCGKCVTVCPSNAQQKVGGVHRYDRDLCVKCGKCADICFAGAMETSGIEMSVEDVMEEVVQDKAYYKDSGGGVTISGGEVLCQAGFAAELAEACAREGISTAVETNLSGDWDSMLPLLEKLDFVMCDLKLMDDEAHRKWTGLGNERIKDNIKRLHTLGIPFIVRTPLIPGVTDSVENIAAAAKFLGDVEGMCCYELLNFNPLGEGKYRSLGRENRFRAARPLPESRLRELKAAAEGCGIVVKVE